MPWLSEEIPDWDELTDEEQEAFREIVRTLGMEFPDQEDGDYFE